MESAVEEYLERGDSQLLLVAISEHISSGQTEGVASLLLLPQHRDVVTALGWDLLALVTPHLPTPSPDSPPWELVAAIAERCSAKEMCLAFLEQLEIVSPSPSLFFHLLQPLSTVLVRLGVAGGRRQVSSLRSLRGLLERVYPSLLDEGNERGQVGENAVSPLIAADCVLQLLQPFTAHLHDQYTNNMAPLQTFWSPLQRECAGLLLTLLGEPLVSCDLRLKSMSPHTRSTVEAIMQGVVRCHCGCLQLMEWKEKEEGGASPQDDEDEDISPFGVPVVGVACFVYLLMVEGVQASYLPSPLHPHHLLHTSLTHTLTLAQRQERYSIMKGLSLLERVVHCVSVHSLPAHCLTTDPYLQTAQCLVDIMVGCPHKNLRQRSVGLLPELINRFSDLGRHKLYRRLLAGCGHAGVQGLLIHCIKNEVDQSLLTRDSAVEGVSVSSPFLGPDSIPLLKEVFTFSLDAELLKEMDRVMAGLNFLRYLLIRDQPTVNLTGIWDMVGAVRSKYTLPLRHSLEASKQLCRGERERQRQELERGSTLCSSGPEVSVEVMREKLPDISVEEQMKMLKLAESQLDMMECVLVRVEELLS